MSRWYIHPQWKSWRWYMDWRWYYAASPKPPIPTLPSNQWKCLIDYCEVLYMARARLIMPFVKSNAQAYVVNAALIWTGFVPKGASPTDARVDPVSVWHRALHKDPEDNPVIKNDDQLKAFLREAWVEAFQCWLPLSPS